MSSSTIALADDRLLELRNLVALRQVRIEIVLAVEHRAVVDLALRPSPVRTACSHAFLVDHRQHAGHGGIDERDIGVGLAAEFGRGAGKQLGLETWAWTSSPMMISQSPVAPGMKRLGSGCGCRRGSKDATGGLISLSGIFCSL
jgi:hypothetical protein